jgi:N-acetylmuramoyl-L-alanine amidase
MRKLYITLCTQILALIVCAQEFTIRQPTDIKNIINTNDDVVYLYGNIQKGTSLTINNNAVTTYATGGFLYKATLQLGINRFECIGTNAKDKKIKKIVHYNYTTKITSPAPSIIQQTIIRTLPNTTSIIPIGYPIHIKAMAPARAQLLLPNGIEIPVAEDSNTEYELFYEPIADDSSWLKNNWSITCILNNDTLKKNIGTSISLSSYKNTKYVKTIGAMPFLKQSLAEDRLGSPKLTYLDTGIILKTVGNIGDDYIVALTNNTMAFIEKDFTKTISNKALYSPITSWRSYTENNYDYVVIGLQQKLPYHTVQVYNANNNAIEVYIYGAINNSSWIGQVQHLKAIKAIDYQQISNELCKVVILTKSKLHWGHSIYYQKNNLVIRVRQQPNSLQLKGLTIGVDAGHGGSNDGAIAITGQKEKNITLAITKIVVDKLRTAGATVITTRTADADAKNMDRLTMFLKKMPQLVVSIHCNSAGGNPLRVGGTSAYYKYIGFKPLAESIYTQMTALPLKEFGLIGNFNFILNSVTDWPNALVETAFISNPEDEEILSDNTKQQNIADAIIKGIEQWLKMAEN